MSNRLTCLLIALCVSVLVAGQGFDQRLIDHFGIDHLTHLQQNAPNVLEQYQFYLDNATEIMVVNGKDLSSYPDISELTAKPGLGIILTAEDQIANDTFNPFQFELDRQENSFVYYRIGSSGQLLAIVPRALYNSRFNDFKGASYE